MPNFYQENVGKDLEDYDCLLTTGLHPEDLISLTGANALDYLQMPMSTTFTGKYPHIRVKVDHPMFMCQREVNFQDCTISNEQLHVFEKQQGTGLKIISSQVEEARACGFTSIYCFANGTPEKIDKWSGFVAMGKYGFTMAPATERAKFEDFLKEHNRPEGSIHELLSSEEGHNLWLENGYYWFGEFDLSDGSQNLEILRSYQEKKLPVQ